MLHKIRKPLGMQKELYRHLTAHKAPVHDIGPLCQTGSGPLAKDVEKILSSFQNRIRHKSLGAL